MKILLIDNYDSFTYNLYHYLSSLKCKVEVYRNDIGKVSKINSVKVTEQFKIEKYSHVMHIVSNVEGNFEKKHSLLDTMLAGFPAGTVTGAPK